MNLKTQASPFTRLASGLLLAGTACLCAAAAAAAAPAAADPTRPADIAPTVVMPVRGAAVVAPVWPQLQSVLVAGPGGSSALVDGRIVRVGGRLGELTVAAIDAQGILLRGLRFEQRLALLPGVFKTPSTTPSPQPAVAVATKEAE